MSFFAKPLTLLRDMLEACCLEACFMEFQTPIFTAPLEHDPKKCMRLFDKIMLQHFESGRVLIAWVIQPKRNTP